MNTCFTYIKKSTCFFHGGEDASGTPRVIEDNGGVNGQTNNLTKEMKEGNYRSIVVLI